MTFLFDRPWMLAVATACAALVAGMLLLGYARRRARLASYGTPEALARLAPRDLARRPTARALRLAAAALSLGLALAGPRWGASTAVLDIEGVDVALALDVSLSMLAEDERPSRLERMKQEVRRMRAAGAGDRVALIVFAGRSYILSPLTADDGAIDLFLDNLDPSIVGQPGSSMAPPLRQGIDLLLASRGDADRALVVMSDGEAFDDRAVTLALAAEAKAQGIHVVTVGFGTVGGGTIPMPGTGGADVKRDADGNVVVTRYEPDLLEAVAKAAGGEFIAADATDKGNRIRRSLSRLEAASRTEALNLSRPLRYQWFAFLAIVLLLLDAWFADGARWPAALRFPRWRRHAATTGAGLLVGLLANAPPVQAQSPTFERALELQRAGRHADAIRAYRAVLADGDRRAVVVYNLGTALVAADSLDGAIETLERATFAGDADVRLKARYNLGLAYLKRGLKLEGDGQSSALQGARRAFRNVLLERPGDRDAQWNYELALRVPTGGGGGGGATPPPGSSPTPPAQGPMSPQQAEALLDASAREERETQARRQRGEQPARADGRRDW